MSRRCPPCPPRAYLAGLGDAPDTDAFRHWFAGSRVVDPQGRPLVVYHGGFDVARSRPPVFRKARRSGYGSGIYFTPERERAESYAKEGGGVVGAYYLRVRNPFVINQSNLEHPLVGALTALGWERAKAAKYVEREEERHGYLGEALERAATARGHDGLFVYYPQHVLSEIVVFDPRQIKSATDNVGSFDPRNPSVLAGTRRGG